MMIEWNGYRLQDPDGIPTPAMLVYRDVVDRKSPLCANMSVGVAT